MLQPHQPTPRQAHDRRVGGGAEVAPNARLDIGTPESDETRDDGKDDQEPEPIPIPHPLLTIPVQCLPECAPDAYGAPHHAPARACQ